MTRCHECDSEVAEIDVFCPYCGISLKPAAPLPEEADDSLASTIMMPKSDVADLQARADKSASETIKPPEAAASPDSAAVTGTTEEPAGDFPTIDDIPPPVILGDLGKTADNIKTKSTSEYTLGTKEQESGASAESASDVESVETQFESAPEPLPADEENVPTAPSVEPSEIPEIGSIEEIVPGTADALSATSANDRADMSIQITEEHPLQAEEMIEAKSPSEPAGRASESGGELFREREFVKETGISKPLEELEVPDSRSPSMFDSVRIMDSGPQDDVDTRIQPGFAPAASELKPPAKVEAEPAKEADAPREPRAQTASSIGLVDTDGRRSGKLKPLAEGAILNNRYEIVRKIGGGGMGAVYLASDNNLGGVLRAVKEMVQTHIEDEQQEKAINDFKRESMILSMLDHPSIPTIYDYFYDEAESRFYLVMKYISGGDLSSRLRAAPEGKIDEKTVTEWAIQIIDVLDYLHNQPSTIVYRDLKPSNIMIDGNSGRIMLIDFGIARSISQKQEKGVTAVGTMGYAPPELFSGNVEPRSDIYSLGSTMFHLLTGADPQSNPLLIFDFQKNPRPRQINPQLSDQIEQILMRSVEYNADARFKSAAEMRRILEEHVANLSTGNLTYGISAAPKSVSLANQTVFCGFCGQRIVATDLFCAFCGAKQPIAQQGVHAEIYAQPAATAKLVVEGTSELTTPTFSLQKNENLLGRRDPMSNIFPEVDLSKFDPQTKISRRHARIWREGTKYMVEDLGSSNGTMLATPIQDAVRLLPHQPHVLSSGDKIKVGDTTLHFMVG